MAELFRPRHFSPDVRSREGKLILNSLKSNHAFSQLKRCESKLSTYVALKQQGPLFDEASNYVGDVCNVTVWRLSYVGNAKRQCVPEASKHGGGYLQVCLSRGYAWATVRLQANGWLGLCEIHKSLKNE
jgi:hypothetical protein